MIALSPAPKRAAIVTGFSALSVPHSRALLGETGNVPVGSDWLVRGLHARAALRVRVRAGVLDERRRPGSPARCRNSGEDDAGDDDEGQLHAGAGEHAASAIPPDDGAQPNRDPGCSARADAARCGQ